MTMFAKLLQETEKTLGGMFCWRYVLISKQLSRKHSYYYGMLVSSLYMQEESEMQLFGSL